MATTFLTKLTELAYNAAMIETAYAGVLSLPVYAPNYDVLKFEPVGDPGLKGRPRMDRNRYGSAWGEFNFYMEQVGFDTFTAQEGVQLGGADINTNAAPSATVCTCATATFTTDGVAAGDKVKNTTTGNEALVVSVDSETQLTTASITGSYTADDVIEVWQMLKYNPPVWGRLCTAAGMKRTGIGATAAWIYEVVDTIHLDTDTVHTGEHLDPLNLLVNMDGMYSAIANAVMDVEFSVDVDEGPPRVTVTDCKGNIYADSGSNYYNYPTTDVPADFGAPTAYQPPVASDSKAVTLALSVIPNDGTYTPVAVTGTCLRRWRHRVGNNIVEQRCAGETYKLGQFLVQNQDANEATLVVKVATPGTFAAPSAFNPYAMAANGDMLDFSLITDSGITYKQVTRICDYYIKDVIGVEDDGNGVLQYTLTLQQANLQPNGTAAQYLKISCA
jgi:hypothetical protein